MANAKINKENEKQAKNKVFTTVFAGKLAKIRFKIFNPSWPRPSSNMNRRSKIMPTVCRRAKIKPFGYHSLRHLAASTLAHDPTVAKKTISGLLGHLSLATTEIYLHAIEESQRDAVKALDGVMVAPLVANPSQKRRFWRKRQSPYRENPFLMAGNNFEKSTFSSTSPILCTGG